MKVVAQGDVRAEVVEVRDGHVARRRVRVTGDRARLERIEFDPPWEGAVPAEGLGQPTFGDGCFAALAHPGAEGFGLALDVDLDGSSGPYVSPPFVVGRCEPGRELAAFWDELDRWRARPPRLITLANNWYQLGYVGRMAEDTVLAELDGFRGRGLDFYCLDDPWDGDWVPETGIWGRLEPGRFPGGLAPLQAGAAPGRIGLWVSPFAGYFDRHDNRVAWGRDHGYEIHEGDWPRLCPAGDRYRAHLVESLRRFTAAGVAYWKLDGVTFDCDGGAGPAAHGHGGRTDQMDRFAALLDEVRTVDPGVVLTFTTGSNPSPWWLRHADFIWRGGLDDDAPDAFDGGRHERFATYIDSCLDAFRPSGVPVSAVVTFSVVENGVRAYQDEADGAGADPDAWARHCWFLVGRGTHHHDLYVAPDSLSEDEWTALTRALDWARAHQSVLARSRMVGGRPQALEPYGFVSENGGRVIVCLRNPAARAQPVTVDLGFRIATDLEPVWGRLPAVVPGRNGATGSAVTAELDPFEVVLVTGRWQPGSRPGPPS